MIHYTTPFLMGNIGKGINAFCELVTDPDDWIVVRDQDTLLFPGAGALIADIAGATDFDLIGAMTNRIKCASQCHGGVFSDNPDIGYHLAVAIERERQYGTTVEGTKDPIPGLFMMFKKKTWLEVDRFSEKSIIFDKQFTRKVTRAGGRAGIALGLYVFHLYRWGSRSPANATKHLDICR